MQCDNDNVKHLYKKLELEHSLETGTFTTFAEQLQIMERWLQIVLGTGTMFSSVGLFVFYLIFEKFVKSLRGSTEKEKVDGVDRIRLRVRMELLEVKRKWNSWCMKNMTLRIMKYCR